MTSRSSVDVPSRVLVVDDDPAVRLLARETLEEAGFAIEEADDGAEAIAAFERERPDLVLLDVMMPGVDGFEACRAIRHSPDGADTPVLMLTGLDDRESIMRAFDAGATDFVSKPISYALLPHRLRYMLRASSNLKALQETRAQLAAAQRAAGVGHWTWDGARGALEISEQLARISGVPAGVLEGSFDAYLTRVHPEDRAQLRVAVESALCGESHSPVDYRFVTADGASVAVHQVLEVTRGGTGAVHVLGSVLDVTEQRAAEEQVRQLAYFDSLTGMASRSYFQQHLEDAIRGARRHQERFALLFLDLDGFKDVNDSLGHDMGDRLLATLARRVRAALRESDFSARFGGDEFCVLVYNAVDEYAAADVADRCLKDIAEPVVLGAQVLRPMASIGIALYPRDGESPETLLKAADSAMYSAKQAGKHRYAFYRPEMTAEAERRLFMEQELREAAEGGDFVLHYQPQIDAKSGRLVGVEALVRWRHPRRGLVAPGEFIGLAERIGIISALGEWVLGTACHQAAAWRRQGIPPLRLAVNISPLHFRDPALVATVRRVLEEAQLPAEYLELEVTEGVMQRGEGSTEVFRALKDLGVQIAIDDFGTGFSSLGSLKHLPIDCLKVDRLFVKDLPNDARASVLIGTIIGLGHALGHTVVAEGVETVRQAQVLSGLGCDVMQGYYFGRPAPADQIPPLAVTGLFAGRTDDSVRIGMPRAGAAGGGFAAMPGVQHQ